MIGSAAATALRLFAPMGVVAVPRGYCFVVQHHNGHSRTMSPGVGWRVPLLEWVCARIDMGERVLTYPPVPVITGDDRAVNVAVTVRVKVTDPLRHAASGMDGPTAVHAVATYVVRMIGADLTAHDMLTGPGFLAARLQAGMQEETLTWGITVLEARSTVEPAPHLRP
ncbi:SPFH domain-containing protein [Actinoplanes sp. NBC_00393]|uniref:SPFH domain-containing protein n=1 Tax=Actinoplanes sp. NBC_00393 TaxID=2975953 RepID=UPI002E1A520A